jgi:hypothetical protein
MRPFKPFMSGYLKSYLCTVTDRYYKYYTADKASTYETWNKIETIFVYRTNLGNIFTKFIEFYEPKRQFCRFLRYLKRKISKFETNLKFCFSEYGDINIHNMTQLGINHDRRHTVLPVVKGERDHLKTIPIR